MREKILADIKLQNDMWNLRHKENNRFELIFLIVMYVVLGVVVGAFSKNGLATVILMAMCLIIFGIPVLFYAISTSGKRAATLGVVTHVEAVKFVRINDHSNCAYDHAWKFYIKYLDTTGNWRDTTCIFRLNTELSMCTPFVTFHKDNIVASDNFQVDIVDICLYCDNIPSEVMETMKKYGYIK